MPILYWINSVSPSLSLHTDLVDRAMPCPAATYFFVAVITEPILECTALFPTL